jgi:hypothetical protein
MIRSAHPTELQTLVAIDDDASTLYAEGGLKLTLDHSHPFVIAEFQRWAEAIRRGLAFVAVDSEDQPIGFVTLGYTDDGILKEQRSVLPHPDKRIAMVRQPGAL